jgi:hypothetical protein
LGESQSEVVRSISSKLSRFQMIGWQELPQKY